MDLERWLHSSATRREVIESTIKVAGGLYLISPYTIPETDLLPQGTFYNLPWWWPFDSGIARSLGQPWLFADNGPLAVYDDVHYQMMGNRANLRVMWYEFANRKINENQSSVSWIGLCHALANMIYHERRPVAGRYTLQQKAGILTLWHVADIPVPMGTDMASISQVLDTQQDWFIANIPKALGSRWYHVIVYRVGNQLYGTDLVLNDTPSSFGVNQVLEAYRPYPFGPDKKVADLSPQLQSLFYQTVHELHDTTMKWDVVQAILAG